MVKNLVNPSERNPPAWESAIRRSSLSAATNSCITSTERCRIASGYLEPIPHQMRRSARIACTATL